MATVSLVRGEDRRDNIRRSLDLIADDVKKTIGDRQVVIKPNFVSTYRPLAATHADHVRGILDFLAGFYKRRVIIAEAASGNTPDGYRNFGYLRLKDEYDVELLDLNREPCETTTVEDSRGNPIPVRISKLLLSPDTYRISPALLKTHDAVVVTLSIKNMAMGSVCMPDKVKIHQGTKATNRNVARLAGLVWPDLAVIDGLEGMEGNGPSTGDPIHVGVALASTDALAADRVACEVMGVDFSRVGYLNLCGDLGEHDMKRIRVAGAPLSECITPFRLHRTVEEQYRWR